MGLSEREKRGNNDLYNIVNLDVMILVLRLI